MIEYCAYIWFMNGYDIYAILTHPLTVGILLAYVAIYAIIYLKYPKQRTKLFVIYSVLSVTSYVALLFYIKEEPEDFVVNHFTFQLEVEKLDQFINGLTIHLNKIESEANEEETNLLAIALLIEDIKEFLNKYEIPYSESFEDMDNYIRWIVFLNMIKDEAIKGDLDGARELGKCLSANKTRERLSKDKRNKNVLVPGLVY